MVARFEEMPTILRPNEVMFFPAPAVQVGPTLRDGRRQILQSAAPHWYAELRYNLATEEEVREWRSAIARMEGGARESIIPVYDRRQAPWPDGVDHTSSKPTTTSGGRIVRRQIIKVHTGTDEALGSALPGVTRLYITCVLSGRIKKGNYFSITDKTGRPRLYMVIATSSANLSSDGTNQGYIDFVPPLRTKISTRAWLDFDDPRSTMTLNDPMTGQLQLRAWETYEPVIVARESFGGVF